eukprot:scaffold41484_cov33-Phaeocystis_antarctica.AAC.1
MGVARGVDGARGHRLDGGHVGERDAVGAHTQGHVEGRLEWLGVGLGLGSGLGLGLGSGSGLGLGLGLGLEARRSP